MNIDGSGPTNVTTAVDNETGPDWSPDGSKIAFASSHGLGSSDVYVVNVDGSGLTELTGAAGGVNSQPAWRPKSKL